MSLLLMAAANSGGEIPIFVRNVGPFFLSWRRGRWL